MKKNNRVFSLVLILSIALGLFVSCPNNTIAGSVERDGRNNAETLITGTINKPLTDSRKFTITLNNATFRAFSRGEDVSSWFVDSEGKPAAIAGLKYRIASPVASGSNKATVRITGTPEVASKDQIHLLIPCDTFQGPITIDVDTEGALRYNIIDYIEPTLTLIKEEDDDTDTASIQLYVKSNPDKYEDNDPDEGLLTPPSIDVTYTDPTGSYKDTQNTAHGSFKYDKKDKYQVQVTLSSKLFEQVDTGETTTQAESDTETKWKDYTGSDVIITKESNWVRYRIREKKTENLSVPSWQRVSYVNADGDEYAVNYDNRSPFSYLKDSDTTYIMNWNVYNQSNPYIWAVIPNAIPTSSKGTLASVKLASKDNYDKNFQNKFNAQLPPKEYFKKSKTDSSDPSYLYGRAVVGEGSSTGNMSYQNIALNRFEIVTALPNGYTLSNDINENDVRIFNGVAHTEYSDSLGGKTRINVLYNDDELKILNSNMKFKVALDSDASAVIPSWGNKVAYVYLDSLTNEDDKLVKLLSAYYDDSNGSTSKTYTKIPMLTGVDIRINPSKLISTTDDKPFLSAKKALKTVDGSTYDGDVSKLLNADMWISVSSSNDKVYARKYIDGEAVDNYYYKPNNMLIIYVIPNEYEYKYGDGGTPDTVKIKSLSWNYRIMDRADYSYLTAYQFPEATDGDSGFSYRMFQNYRHTPNSLSINADMTTGLTKTVGKGLYLDMDGVTKKEYTVPEVSSSYSSMVQFNMTTPLNLNSLVTENSWYQMHKVREVPIDGSSIPIRELKSGSFEQDVYNKDNKEGRTIPGTDLLNIAKAAKRKGYRVKGFSRGRNHYNGVIPYDGAYYGSISSLGSGSVGTASIISDLVPYKGFDDFGEPVDWEIKWNGNVMDENSPVFTEGITLELTDALAYRRYILHRNSSASTSNYLLKDWYNTTYIYLVWEIDPTSPYYSLQSNTATDPGQLKFVRIPGDLQWPGYRNPYYDDGGKLVYLDYSSGPFHIQHNTGGDRDIGTGVGAEFNNVGRIAKYDFEIADREMYADLFDIVYQWATTQGGYDFTSSSEETYKPVDRNDYEAYDWNPPFGETSAIVEETSSFDESKIYGGVRTVPTEKSSVGTYSSVTSTDKGNHPVTNVNIYDAMLFCNALTDYANEVLGVTPKLTKAYGDVKTYYDIKGKLNYQTIHNAPESTGYRLPTYNEWFAAATIVPDTDDYLMTATSTDLNEFFLAYSNKYYDYHGMLIGTGIVEKSSNSSSGSTYGPSLSGKSYGTVYPFMQSLNGFSGIANEAAVALASSTHVRDADVVAKYAWTLGRKVTGKSYQTRSVFGNEVLPNSLGLYDMSGNVSEWVLGTGEIIPDVDNPTQTETINNYPSSLGLIAVVGGDWTGEYSRSNLYHQGGSGYESKGDVWYYLPPMDRMYDQNNYWTVRYKNTSVGTHTSRMLEYNQRSYNIGFRVCRTIKDSTV